MSGPELAGPGPVPGEVVPLRLPRPAELFARRAERFRRLAPGHAAGAFLEAMGALCRAQGVALARAAASPGRPLPPRTPLRAVEWPRPGWRDALSAIVADLAPLDLRGRYQGAFSMAWGLAFTLSTLIGGEVLHHLGGRALWVGCLLVASLVALAHLLAGPARRGTARQAVTHSRSTRSSSSSESCPSSAMALMRRVMAWSSSSPNLSPISRAR